MMQVGDMVLALDEPAFGTITDIYDGGRYAWVNVGSHSVAVSENTIIYCLQRRWTGKQYRLSVHNCGKGTVEPSTTGHYTPKRKNNNTGTMYDVYTGETYENKDGKEG